MTTESDQSILIVDDNDELREMLAMILESNFTYSLLEAASVEEAKEYLQDEDFSEEICLIVCDYYLPDGNGGDIYKILGDKNKEVPFVLMSLISPEESEDFKDFKTANPHNSSLQKPFQMGNVVSVIKEVLDGAADNVPKQESEKYIQVSGKRLMKFEKLKLDIYLMLSTTNYVKIHAKEDTFSKEVIQKYLNKGTEFYYIPYDDYVVFIDAGLDEINRQLTDPNLTLKEKASLQAFSVEHIHDCLKNVGMKDSTMKLAEKTAQATLDVIKNNRSLKSLANGILNNQDYIYGHSVMVSYITTAIVEQLSWASSHTARKLALASLIHDLVLTDPKLAQINDVNSMEFKSLPKAKQEEILNHPIEAAKILRRVPESSLEIEEAVAHHHEKPDGKGFPEGLDSSNIPIMSAIFIVAHDVCNNLFNKGFDKKSNLEILDSLKSNYNKGHFLKAFEGLKKAFPEEES